MYLSIVLCLTCIGCKTTADNENGERPTYVLSFLDDNGQIVGRFEAGGPSTGTMLLKAGETFQALYVTRDPGGIQKARITYPIAMNVIEPMRDDEDPPARWVDVSSGVATTKAFEYTGDITNRVNGAAYGIKFMANTVGDEHIIALRSEDYGTGGVSTDGLVRSAQFTVRYTTNTTGVE